MSIIVEGSKPYTGGDGIGIDTNKVISVLLRAENNLIKLNGDNELYTDLQLADGIEPEDDLPVGITVGKILEEDGRDQNGLLLNWKTTSGDYARWIYGADGEIYFDGGTGEWKQVYYADEVDELFTALRNELATVAFTGDYNDLINRPEIPVVYDGGLTVKKNGTTIGTFTANQQADEIIDITVPTKTSDLDNDSGFIDNTVDDLVNYTKTSDLAAVALSNDYDDLDDKPTIGDAVITIQKNGNRVNDFTANATSNKTINITLDKTDVGLGNVDNTSDLDKPISTATQSALDLKANSADLATVATTGSYTDLINKPTIGDGTITIQKNGVAVDTFTTNQSNAKSVNITMTKSDVGLSNVDNTSDLAKPISTATQTALDGKQATISDLATIRSNATDGKSAYDTIQTYGDIVTHNVSEFATAAQGALADTAVQPGDLATVATTGDYDDLLDKPTIPTVINNVTSTDTANALSAAQGKVLQDQIDDLKALGKFLSLWDASTGLPISFPEDVPYTYSTGDYFLVETVGTTNYRPNGASYTGTASTTVETDELEVGDLYIYDGQVWLLQINHGKTVSFANLAGSPSDNAALDAALDAKADISSLATVATSGSYADLSNKPTIGNATITIQKNGTSVDTFTTNANTAKSINITMTKSDVGLGNVDNTSDANKPISTATQAALNLKANSADLATVATSGDYDDLLDKPNLATVATSGSYNDLIDKPSIHSGQVQSDWTQTNTSEVDYIKNKPNLATVATSGSYNDLSNKPTIPAAQVQTDWNATSGMASIKNKPTLATVATTGAYSDLSGTPTLATVATSGSYSDLTNKPTIPAAQVNSDWDATSGVAKILNKPTIPSKTSDLTNDSGYITSSSVPTKTSELTNDSGFITSAYHDSSKQDTLISGTNIKTVNSNSLLGSGNLTLNDVKVSATAPSSPTEGMVWYDTTNDQLKVYDGSQWNITGKEYNAGEGIEIKNGPDYSAMQGPAPDGFHVPLNTEWQDVKDIRTALGGGSSDGTNFGIALKLPFSGFRDRTNASINDQGYAGRYWSSSRRNYDNAYYLYIYSSTIGPQYTQARAYGMSIRPFKDIPTIPTSSWTKLYGTSIESGGIFWSSADGLISLSSDGQTWITIMDKNLGATTVWNNGDTLSEANCGKYYQWGNNYGFPRTGSVTTSSTQVNASTYGPGNYYSSSTFITYDGRWDTTDNGNLRGGTTGVVTLDNAITNTGVLSVNGQTGNVTTHTTITVTLTSAGWSSKSQTVSATGVTASNTVIVSPAPDDIADYADCGVYGYGQGSGTLTFKCDKAPSGDIVVNVLIFN